MYQKVLFIALFGVILFGLAYFFIKYYKKTNIEEGFQVTPYIVQSDTFPDISIPHQTFDVSGFSMAYTIQEDFINFITDWHNFSGYMDLINNDLSIWLPSGGVNITYTDNNGKTITEQISGDIIISWYDHVYDYQVPHIYYYSQVWNANSSTVGGGLTKENLAGGSIHTGTQNEIPANYINNFTTYINFILNNSVRIQKKFLQNIQLWNFINLQNKINSTNYITNNWYNAYNNDASTNLETFNDTYNLGVGAVNYSSAGPLHAIYNAGILRRTYSNYTVTDVATAKTEKLRINVYGSITSNHQSDFQKCILYGAAFNFKDNGLIDLYLNIPYRDSNLNGSKIYYSYGLFLTEVIPVSSDQPFNYTSNDICIKYNQYMNNLHNYTNNTIQTPSAFIQSVGYDGNNNINSIKFSDNSTYSYPSGVPTISLTTLISNLRIDQQFVGQINPQILSLVPQTMHRYMTSYAYNMSSRVLDANLSDIVNYGVYTGSGIDTNTKTNVDKASYLLALAYNNHELAITNGDTSNADNWSNYLNKYLYNNISYTVTTGRNDGRGDLRDNIFGGTYPPSGGIINPSIYLLSHGALIGKSAGYTTTPTYSAGVEYHITANQFYVKQFQSTDLALNSVNADGTNTDYQYYKIQFTGSNPNVSYKTTDPTWDLHDNTIENMTSDYKSILQKLLPDYGLASNINVLDHPTLNFIAQKFYDYSEGLSEIVMIYDVYIIGSNMMDIRYDKKQRLPPNQYLSLRNAYIPQLTQYNNLLAQYNEGTWVDSGLYSNTTDVRNSLSTMLVSLDPIFNPVYTLSNANPTDLQNQINILSTTNGLLTASLTAAAVPALASSNTSLSNFSISPAAQSQLTTNTQVQARIDSNTNLIYQLSNQLLGIETNVARIFFTYYDGSNGGVGGIITSNYINNAWKTYTIVINGMALGSNAALTYNNIYNANLEVDIGQSQGNVNYQPTIDYDYNITPPIQCCNIGFMQQAASLYTNAMYTDLSGYTSNIYAASNGDVLVDKIYGFTQLDDNTCGFTWQESQYDPYTNKPKSRIVDVELKFAYDNTNYEQPILMLDNTNKNIYFTGPENISNVTNTIIPGINSNIANLQSELQNLLIQGSNYTNTVLQPLLNQIPITINNFMNSNYVWVIDYTQLTTTYGQMRSYYYSDSNILPASYPDPTSAQNGWIVEGSHVTQITLSQYYTTNNLSNKVDFINSLISGIPITTTYPKFDNNGIFTINYLNNNLLKVYTSSQSPITPPTTILSWMNNNGEYISLLSTIKGLNNNYFIPLSNNITTLQAQIQKEQDLIPNDSNFLLSNINGKFQFGILDTDDFFLNLPYIKNISYTLSNLTTNYFNNNSTMNNIANIQVSFQSTENNNLYGARANNIQSLYNAIDGNYHLLYALDQATYSNNIIQYQSTITAYYTILTSIKNLISNINVTSSNPYIIIERELPEENTLDNNDGACPANLTCEDPGVMGQLLDFYNLDSNNSKPITRILKGWTVNPYQCDYLVEYADSNGNSTQDAISFQVGQDIQSCQYYISSNLGYGTGYFIMDKTPYVEDTFGTDISGFQYVGNALTDFLSTVTTTMNPIITTASNAASEMYNAFSQARMMTYNAMGRLNSSSNFNYNTIKQALTTDAGFVNSIFNDYPTVTYYTNVYIHGTYNNTYAKPLSNMDTIIRIGITNNDTLVVVYNGHTDYVQNYFQILDSNHNLLQSPIQSNYTINFTGAAEYSITPTPSGSFIATYISDKEPIPPNQVSNMNISLDYINIKPLDPLTTYSYVIDDLNIKKITSLLISDPSFCYDNYNTSSASNINFLDPIFLQLAGLSPITYSQLSNSLNTVEYVINPPNAQTVERHFIIVGFDFDRTKFQSNSECWVKLNIFNTIDSYKHSQFYRTYNASDQSNLDTFRNYFNTSFSITNGYPYNSVIGQIYTCDTDANDIVAYSASVYYKDSANNYITTVVPNIPEFNNVRHFTCRLFQLPSATTVNIYNFADVGTGPISGTSVNDINYLSTVPTRDYYVNTFLYTNLRFIPKTNYQLIQLQFFKDTTNLYNKIVNLSNYLNPSNLTSTSPVIYNGTAMLPTTITFNTPTSVNGFSMVTGNCTNVLHQWFIEGSIDGNNFIPIYNQNYDYEDDGLTTYYQLPILSFLTNTSNIPLSQLPIKGKTLIDCGIIINSNINILSNVVNLYPITDGYIDADGNNRFNINNILGYIPNNCSNYIDFYIQKRSLINPTIFQFNTYYDTVRINYSLSTSCQLNNTNSSIIVDGSTRVNNAPSGMIPITPNTITRNLLANRYLYYLDSCTPPITATSLYIYSLVFKKYFMRTIEFGTGNSISNSTIHDELSSFLGNIGDANNNTFSLHYSLTDSTRNYMSWIASCYIITQYTDDDGTMQNNPPANYNFVISLQLGAINNCSNLNLTDFNGRDFGFNQIVSFKIDASNTNDLNNNYNNNINLYASSNNYSPFNYNAIQYIDYYLTSVAGLDPINTITNILNNSIDSNASLYLTHNIIFFLINNRLPNYYYINPPVSGGPYGNLSYNDYGSAYNQSKYPVGPSYFNMNYSILYSKFDYTTAIFSYILEISYIATNLYINSNYEGILSIPTTKSIYDIVYNYLSNTSDSITFGYSSNIYMEIIFFPQGSNASFAHGIIDNILSGNTTSIINWQEDLIKTANISNNILSTSNINSYGIDNNYNSNTYISLQNTGYGSITSNQFNPYYPITNVVNSLSNYINSSRLTNDINYYTNFTDLTDAMNDYMTNINGGYTPDPTIQLTAISVDYIAPNNLSYNNLNYTILINTTDGSNIFYIEYNVLFSYPTNIYNGYIFFRNPSLFKNLNTSYTYKSLVLYDNINTYTEENNYFYLGNQTLPLLADVNLLNTQRNIYLLSNITSCSIDDVTSTSDLFINYITNTKLSLPPNYTFTQTPIFSQEILFIKDNSSNLENNYVISVYDENALSNEYYFEFNVYISGFENCSNIHLHNTFIREIQGSNLSNLLIQGYRQYSTYGYNKPFDIVDFCSNINYTATSSIFMNYFATNTVNFTNDIPSLTPYNYANILYTKNNISNLQNNYIFSIRDNIDLRKVYYMEYTLNITGFQDCLNLTFTPNYYRSLNSNILSNIQSQGYTSYFDNIDIQQNLLNNNIDIGSLETLDSLLNTSIIFYTKYEYSYGNVIYSYLITTDYINFTDYSIYFFYKSADGSNTNSNSQINSTNISNVISYANSNGFTSYYATVGEDMLMRFYNIDATNPLLINYINSQIQQDSHSQNRIDTITNIMTDYNNLQTSYIVSVWPNGTDITTLQTTQPQYIYQYTLNILNIINHSNFSYSLSNPNGFIDNTTGTYNYSAFTLNGNNFDSSTTYSNSILYNNGALFDLNAPLIPWEQCWSNMSPIDPLNTNFIFNHTNINIGGSYSGYTIKGIVANKKNTSTKQNNYILDIYYPSHSPSNYYYAVKVVNLYPDVYQQCDQYYTAYGGYGVFNITSIAPITYTKTALSNYLYSNGYTSNYISNTSEGFTNPKPSYNFISLESSNPFTISDFQLFTHRDTPIESKLVKKESNILVFQIEEVSRREVIGYSFTTNSTSPEYDPTSWSLKGYSGKNQIILDSRKMGKSLPRNYQLPLMYINGNTRTKVLPQKTLQTKQEEITIDKNLFIKYYKQKINPSMTIQPKKYIKDNNIYYVLYDEYDLNKNLVGSDFIVGFVMNGDKIKKAILYEDDEGNMKPFDLKKKHMKTYWDSRIMLPLLFENF